MPSPYKTNCFNYNEFGCKSRRDCIDQCNVKWALINCNGSLPNDTFINRHNDKDKFGNECDDKHKNIANTSTSHLIVSTNIIQSN